MSNSLSNAPSWKVSVGTEKLRAPDILTPKEETKLAEKLASTPKLKEFLRSHPEVAQKIHILDEKLRAGANSGEKDRVTLYQKDYLPGIGLEFIDIEKSFFSDDGGIISDDTPSAPPIDALPKRIDVFLSRYEEKIQKIDNNKTVAETKETVAETDTTVAETKETVAEAVKTVAKTDKTEVKTEDAKTKERDLKFKEAANGRLEELYSMVWGEEKFKSLPELRSWKDSVAKDLKNAGISPESPNYEQKLTLNIFTKFQSEIIQHVDPAKKEAFRTLIKTTESDFGADLIKRAPLLREPGPSQEAIKNSITSPDNARLVRIGDRIYHGDEIFTIKGNKIEKSIRSESGIEVPLGTVAIPDRMATIRRAELLANMQFMTGDQNFDGSARDIKKFSENSSKKIDELKTTSSLDKQKLEGLKKEKKTLDQEEHAGFDNAVKTTKLIEEIEKLEETVRLQEQEIKSIESVLTKFTEAAKEFQSLADTDETDIVRYKEHIKERDEGVRKNLRFLASTHLDTILGQSGIDALIRSSNAHMDSFTKVPVTERSDIELGVAWTDVPHKQLLAEAIERLTGSKLFKRNNGSDSLGHPIEVERIIKEGPRSGENVDAAYIRSKLGLEQGKTLDIGKIESSITQGTEKDTQKEAIKEATEKQK